MSTNIGDLVSNLILDSSRYSAGAQAGIGANKALSGSIDSMIGQLERQKKALLDSRLNNTERILKTATQPGTTEGSINAALGLNDEVDGIRKKNAELDAETAATLRAKQAGESLIATLIQQRDTYGMDTDALILHQAAQDGVSQADYRRIQAMLLDAKHRREGTAETEADTASKLRAKQAGESLIATLERQKAIHGMAKSDIILYDLAQKGASKADLARAAALQAEIAEMGRAAAAQTFLTRTKAQATGQTGGLSRGTMVLTESIRGLEDAVAGYTNNGLKGMFMATTNNINQIGYLVGGHVGLALSIGAIAGLIGASLIPAIYKWATGYDLIIEKEKKLAEQTQKRHEIYMATIAREADAAANLEKSRRDQRRTINGELPTEGNLEGTPGANSKQLREIERQLDEKKIAAEKVVLREAARLAEMKKRHDELVKENMGESLGNFDDSVARKRIEGRDKEIEKLRELGAESKRISADAMRDFKAADADQAAAKSARLKQETEERIRETNRMKDALEQARREGEEMQEEDRKKRVSAQVSDMKQFASQLEANISQLSPELGQQVQLEKRRRQIDEDLNRGLITQKEANVLYDSAKVFNKPDAASGSPAAIQAGTTAAYSSIVKSMRANEQIKLQEEQKKLAQEQVKILNDMNTKIKATDETVPVDFF